MDSKQRRTASKKMLTSLGILLLGDSALGNFGQTKELEKMTSKPLNGKINHAVCKWCYPNISLEEFSEKTKDIGVKGIDLLTPEQWTIAQKYGVTCSLGTDSFASIENGFNEKKNHAQLIANYKALIKKAADQGVGQVIVFSGNKGGKTDKEGWENCATGLDPLVKLAEESGITLVMELLNSKVDHNDYHCDHTGWGVTLANKIGSPNFKLLYDIYHMQIMEGDVIRTIRNYHDYISHYHTGGVPGRNEINSSQELNYPAIMKTIHETGFDGFVAQEFIPTYSDKLTALEEGINICDI
ncbi:MAG: TIM barrel protein [Bacteroidota bacterium]